MRQRVKAIFKIVGITLFVLIILAVLLVLLAISQRETSIMDDFQKNPEIFMEIAEVLYETTDNPRYIYSSSIENENTSIQAELRQVFSKYRIDHIKITDCQIYFRKFLGEHDLIYSPDDDLVKERQGLYYYTDFADWYGYFLNPV